MTSNEFPDDTIYHVYCRGNKKELLFLNDSDYRHYLEKLVFYSEKSGFEVLFYCLMPNHVHLCLERKKEITLSDLMQRLHLSYTKYFQHKYHIVGHVFQSRYRFKKVMDSQYLGYLSGYIHCNPEFGEYKDAPEKYPYSSAAEYALGAEGICATERLLKEFLGYDDYNAYLYVFRNSARGNEVFEKYWAGTDESFEVKDHRYEKRQTKTAGVKPAV